MDFYTYRATCVDVVDGDTLDLDVDLGFQLHFTHRFRVSSINAPEIFGVPHTSPEYILGMKAKQRVIDLVMGQPLVIETQHDKAEKYGRYLATIYVNGVDVGQTLVNEGLAVPFMVQPTSPTGP